MEPDLKTGAGPTPGWFAAHAAARTDIYAMLAALLLRTPTPELLELLKNIRADEALPEKTGQALDELRQAACGHSPAALEEEFNALFVGLGNGEITPYASWYLAKRLQAAPLASLRWDLMELGIVRSVGNPEPEDHAGALCEIMALISSRRGESDGERRFFRRHLAPWMKTFFEDLRAAKSADFYRKVGSFGRCFMETEGEFWNRGPIPKANKEA